MIFPQEHFVCVHTNLLDILTRDKQQGPGISSLKLTLKISLEMTNPGVCVSDIRTGFDRIFQTAVKLNDIDFNCYRSKEYLFRCCLKTKRLADIASKLSKLTF